MELEKVINERHSTRAFLDKPVPRETIEKLLTLSTKAPSAINLQPWEFTVVMGVERKRLSKVLVKSMRERNISCGPGAVRPLPEYFMDRQRKLMDCILPHLEKGILFQDFINEGSCNFYGAPAAIIVTIDQVFSNARLVDLGIVIGYMVLTAHNMGLGTCPIGLISAFADEIKEMLNIADEKDVVMGIGVGYPDPDSPINQAISDRAPIHEVARFY
ncbi:MAG: nitroreductase [Deltaproteobacteria bacterium]|nr:MAG: nitroreductase [Deltaproteobacteria bacterium]